MPRLQRKLRPDAPTCWGRRRALARLVWVGRLAGVMGKAVVKTAQAIPEDRLCFEHALRFGAHLTLLSVALIRRSNAKPMILPIS